MKGTASCGARTIFPSMRLPNNSWPNALGDARSRSQRTQYEVRRCRWRKARIKLPDYQRFLWPSQDLMGRRDGTPSYRGSGPTRTGGSAQIIGGPLGILADLPAQQDTRRAIRAAAKHRRILNEPLLHNPLSAIPGGPFQKDGLNPAGTRADRREARGTNRSGVRSPQRTVFGSLS